ncbi:hypothetical protein LCGC14_1420260 [marine sediment metagenome]|uniref:Uncharacterized protein n=1 Tax=marine sediment metagenome TaxID=412755 RepID=A0A0F9M746_9ZZZZ
MQELERAYDTEVSLQPYLLKDGVITAIPRSTSETMATWLERHKHNINTDRLVLIPMVSPTSQIEGILIKLSTQEKAVISDTETSLVISTWIRSGGQLYSSEDVRNAAINPNLAHYLVFRNALKNILFKYDVITRNSLAALERVVGRQVSRLVTYMKADPTNDHYIQQPKFMDFATIYARLQAEVIRGVDAETAKEIMSEINFLFRLQYRIYGLNVDVKLSLLASRTYLGWTAILNSYKISGFTTVDYSQLAKFLGHSTDIFSRAVSRLASGEIKKQESETIERYINSILLKVSLSERLKTLLRLELTIMAQPYLNSLRAIEDSLSTIENKIGELREKYPNNRRLDLIEDIITIIGTDNLLTTEVSLLLFGDEKYLTSSFLATARATDPFIEMRPDRINLMWMKNSILESDLSDRKKEALSLLIDNWMQSNPYSTTYFNPSSVLYKRVYGSDIDQITFDLIGRIIKKVWLKLIW